MPLGSVFRLWLKEARISWNIFFGSFTCTGGVAKNPGVVRAVEEKIGEKLYICPEPEIVGAVGAALYALEQM